MTETHRSKIFSFAEIVKGRDSSVRVTDDGLLFVVDLVMVMTGLARDQAGLILRRLSNKLTLPTTIDRPSIGGGHPTKLITFEHAIELAMILPGETAKKTRIAFANIIRRYLAGDESLVSEVRLNANSSESISQMARDSITKDENHTKERIFRKRVSEQDDTLMQLIVCDKKQKILMQEIELKEKHSSYLIKSLEVQTTIIESYTSLCENKVLDDEAKLLFKKNLLKIAYQSVIVGWDNTTDSTNVRA